MIHLLNRNTPGGHKDFHQWNMMNAESGLSICEMQGFTYINNSLKQKLSSHKWINYFLNQKCIELSNLVLDTVTVVISKHNCF